ISAGLETSTVTPGRTAPEASFTTPVMVAWANARAGTSTRSRNAPNPTCNLRMQLSPFDQHAIGPELSGLQRVAGELHAMVKKRSTQNCLYATGLHAAHSTKWMVFRLRDLRDGGYRLRAARSRCNWSRAAADSGVSRMAACAS